MGNNDIYDLEPECVELFKSFPDATYILDNLTDEAQSPDATPLSTAELIRETDKWVRDLYIWGRHCSKMEFSDPVERELTDCGVLETFVAHPRKWLPLHQVVHYLQDASRFNFWRCVFKNRRRIPQKELLQVWYTCLMDNGGRYSLRVLMDDGTYITTHNNGTESSEMPASCALVHPLLIDDPIVSFWYSRNKKPGWNMLQYIHGRRHQTLKMPDSLRQAISEDCVPIFAIHLLMSKMKVSFSLLAEVVENEAFKIFRFLLEDKKIPKDAISLSELCCYLATQFSDDVSVPLLGVIEELNPGFIKGVKDAFGRNLLWYAVQNMHTGWFHPDCKLTPFLLDHGCNPQNANQIALTWQTVTDGLSLEQKRRLMRRRYHTKHHTPSSPKLRISQPLENLK